MLRVDPSISSRIKPTEIFIEKEVTRLSKGLPGRRLYFFGITMKVNGSPAPRFETNDDRTYCVSYFPAHPLAVSKETSQVETKPGPSYRTSLEFLPGAAQSLTNYGIDWS